MAIQDVMSYEDMERMAANKRIYHDPNSSQLHRDVAELNNTNILNYYGLSQEDNVPLYELEKYIADAKSQNQKKALLTDLSTNTSVAPAVRKRADAIMNFNYNPDKDPAYKSYVDMYNRQGQSAAKQTLNNLNAANMGRNSSYSSAATAQVQQAYAQKASEMIPTLAEQAYNKLLQQYGIEKDIADTEYNRKLTAYQTLADDYTRGLTDKGLALSNEKAELDLKYYEDMLRNQVAMGEISLEEAELLLRQQIVQTQIAEEYGMSDAGYNSEMLRKSSLGYGTSSGGGSGGGSSGGSSATSKQFNMADKDNELSNWLYSNLAIDRDYIYDDYALGNENANVIYTAVRKLKDPKVIRYLTSELIAAGYTYDNAIKKINEYKTNVLSKLYRTENGTEPLEADIEDMMQEFGLNN